MADYTIPILKRSIAVLRLISEDRTLTTKAISVSLGLSHATAYRILQTLRADDLIRQTDAGTFELSFGLLPLLQPLQRHELLIESVSDPLKRLSKESGLTAKLTVRQGVNATMLFRAESPRATSIAVRLGTSVHIALGSSGTVLLSALNEVERAHVLAEAPPECWRLQMSDDVHARLNAFAKTGVCQDFGKSSPGTHAMSAAVRSQTGAILGAITLIGFPHDFDGERGATLQAQLLAVASQCNEVIRGNGSLEHAATA
jgi:DNA-binding IclR family transcriptional regulator